MIHNYRLLEVHNNKLTMQMKLKNGKAKGKGKRKRKRKGKGKDKEKKQERVLSSLHIQFKDTLAWGWLRPCLVYRQKFYTSIRTSMFEHIHGVLNIDEKKGFHRLPRKLGDRIFWA